MIFIENPHHFFQQIGALANSICDYVTPAKDKCRFLVFSNMPIIRKVNGQTAEAFRSFLLKKVPTHELEEIKKEFDGSIAMHYTDFCDFSMDESKWITSADLRKDGEFSQIMDADDAPDKIKFYIRDITKSFYTIITEQTMDVFYVYLPFLASIDGENVYLNLYPYHVDVQGEVELDSNGISLVEMQNDCGDAQSLKVSSIEASDFVDVRPIKPQAYLANKEYLEQKKNNYLKVFEKDRTIDIFDKEIDIKSDGYMPAMNSFVAILEKVISTENPQFSKRIQGLFRLFSNFVNQSSMSRDEFFKVEKQIDKSFAEGIVACFKEMESIVGANMDFLSMAVVVQRMKESMSALITAEEGRCFSIRELSSLRLFDRFFTMISAAERAENEKRDSVDRFRGNLDSQAAYDGSLSNMFANFLVKSVATSVYESYKESSMGEEVENAKSARREFLKTDESKKYLRELIELDFKYIVLAIMSRSFQIYDTTGCASLLSDKAEDFDDLLDNYTSAMGLYASVVADEFKLSFPCEFDIEDLLDKFEDEYDELEEPIDDNLFVMQKVLLMFPYELKFYKKYFELGGKLTEELYLYAAAHMIDLSEMYEKEKERIEKEKAEAEIRKAEAAKRKAEAEEIARIEAEKKRIEDERKKAEAEERKRIQAEKRKAAAEEKKRLEAEKRRAKEEKDKLARELIPTRFGTLVSEYPDLFEHLKDNPIWLENSDAQIENHNNVSEVVFKYINDTYGSVYLTMYAGNSVKYKSKIRNITGVHGKDVTENNAVLFYDSTVFGSGKDGFVMTNERICVRNFLEQATSMSLRDVKRLSFDEKNIFINDTFRLEMAVCKLSKEELVNIFNYCICNLLCLLHSKGGSAPGVSNSPTPATPGGRRCECGNVVSEGAKFCSKCGAKQPEHVNEWFCSSCGKKNASDSNFCGQCGTRRSL